MNMVTAVFPCYDDAGSIEWVVERAIAALDGMGYPYDVVVVNDGSADESATVLSAMERRLPMLRVVHHDRNQGYGGALRSGFRQAHGTWVFYTDGDGQYDPAEMVRLFNELRTLPTADVVQGYKQKRGDGLLRYVVGRLYHQGVALAFGLTIRDTDCDFRLIRREVLDRCHLGESSGAFCVELVNELQRAGARFVEVPVSHHPRRAGRSTFFRPRAILKTLADLVPLWWRLRVRRRPPLRSAPEPEAAAAAPAPADR